MRIDWVSIKWWSIYSMDEFQMSIEREKLHVDDWVVELLFAERDGMESFFSSEGCLGVDEAVFDARLYFREADIMVLDFSEDAVGGNAPGDEEDEVVGDEGTLWRDAEDCVFWRNGGTSGGSDAECTKANGGPPPPKECLRSGRTWLTMLFTREGELSPFPFSVSTEFEAALLEFGSMGGVCSSSSFFVDIAWIFLILCLSMLLRVEFWFM
jgi:hypothetical protein